MNFDYKKELDSFSGHWQGGYYEGDPLDPLSRSTYGQIGFVSSIHATYLSCIKPYINPESKVIEIGPGRGAWTKCMLEAKEIWALDALPESHNQFYNYLNHPNHVKYFQVEDFSCSMLPEDHFNFLFSFGCLCHVSFEGISSYAKNLHAKLKPGSHCFWMVADYKKYNETVLNLEKYTIWRAMEPRIFGFRKLGILFFKLMMKLERRALKDSNLKVDNDHQPRKGRWYDAQKDRTCSMLESNGYQIVDKDMGTSLRDPVIHFVRK